MRSIHRIDIATKVALQKETKQQLHVTYFCNIHLSRFIVFTTCIDTHSKELEEEQNCCLDGFSTWMHRSFRGGSAPQNTYVFVPLRNKRSMRSPTRNKGGHGTDIAAAVVVAVVVRLY